MSQSLRTVVTMEELFSARNSLPGTVGLVPTMGYLHEGHISLVRRARAECDHVVTSIFVNPTQFGPAEDLEKYPRDIENDTRLLENAGAELVWTPTVKEMYPDNFQTWVEVEKLTKPLEGAMRPGHFRGVSTIVAKLFNAVRPDKAYFGQKDAQQAAVIRQMTRDLNYPIEIVVCPIIREPDGLAMSSRNTYLDSKQRQAAIVLFRALTQARKSFENGNRDAESLRKIVKSVIEEEALAQVQYVSCADYDTLTELDTINRKALLSLAVYFGKTRLIDNFILG